VGTFLLTKRSSKGIQIL